MVGRLVGPPLGPRAAPPVGLVEGMAANERGVRHGVRHSVISSANDVTTSLAVILRVATTLVAQNQVLARRVSMRMAIGFTRRNRWCYRASRSPAAPGRGRL